MLNIKGQVVDIMSYPRRGTHFLIDVLRRNFAEFAYNPPIWASAEQLYYNLDREVLDGPAWSTASISRPNLLVKTHRLPFSSQLEDRLVEICAGRPMKVLTPYRPISDIAKSYHRYVVPETEISEFLHTSDPFFRNGMTVHESMKSLFNFALDRSILVDVRAGQREPDKLVDYLQVDYLQDALSLTPRNLSQRLPTKRMSHGPLGEIVARLTGRSSSEVIVPKVKGVPTDSIPRPEVALLENLEAELKRRSAIYGASDELGDAR